MNPAKTEANRAKKARKDAKAKESGKATRAELRVSKEKKGVEHTQNS